MQNKPNFRDDRMNINIDMTRQYGILPRSKGQKTNPIQTQLKPKQTQFKPNKAKNKPNSNPIQTQTKPIQSQFYQSLSPRAAYLTRNRGPIYHP
jgi:hypothetical protein